MTRGDVLKQIAALAEQDEKPWMMALGAALTISARDAYVPGELAADAVQLMGYNELQHQVYGRLLSPQTKQQWTRESFVDGLMDKARWYKVESGLISALSWSLRDRISE